MIKLNGYTMVAGEWYGPDDKLSKDVAAQIGEHAFEGGEHPYADARAKFVATLDGKAEPATGAHREAGAIPPKGGPGSGTAAWAAYAGEVGVDLEEDASREDIIAAIEAAGRPTEYED
jgi:hypothetical protein